MAGTSITPTPTQLRALTHPVRLRILGILRIEGAQTATALASRLGLNSGATSYHLRQLAQHGFITDDEERGNGRERWWRAAHSSTRADLPDKPDEGDEEAMDAYLQTVVTTYAQVMQAAVEELSTLPPEWKRAGTFSDWYLQLSPTQLRRLVARFEDLVEEFEAEPEEDGAEKVTVMLHAFPRPGEVGGGTVVF
jgi:DNA-binding transcriptional ArsR family regulator